jgi:cell division protein FtsW
MERLRRFYPDPVIFFCVVLLFLVGLLAIISVRVGPHIGEDLSLVHFKKPFLFTLAFIGGLFSMSFISYAVNYRSMNNQRFVYGLVLLSLGLLLVVFLKKLVLGKPVDRWLVGNSIQPSEFSKLILVIFISYYVSRKGYITRLRFFGWAILVVVAHSLLLFLQPDKGMAIFILLVSWLLLWIGGTSPKVYLPVGGLFVGVGSFMILFGGDYVMRRLSAWQDPISDPFGSSYQVIQSLLAFMNGGLLGQGYGKGFQKLGPLTQADTDYILAVIGEELGLPGLIFIFVLFAILIWRLFRIASETSDTFGRIVVTGVALNILFSVLINTMMAVNLLPPKGTPLPFVSYGTSHLLASLLGLGIVGSVYKRQLYMKML